MKSSSRKSTALLLFVLSTGMASTTLIAQDQSAGQTTAQPTAAQKRQEKAQKKQLKANEKADKAKAKAAEQQQKAISAQDKATQAQNKANQAAKQPQ